MFLCKNLNTLALPTVAQLYPKDHDMNKLKSRLPEHFLPKWVFERKVFKYFPLQIPMSNFDPHCSPTLPHVVMILTNLNLHHLEMLKHEFQLF